jgi:hypothetical protein
MQSQVMVWMQSQVMVWTIVVIAIQYKIAANWAQLETYREVFITIGTVMEWNIVNIFGTWYL